MCDHNPQSSERPYAPRKVTRFGGSEPKRYAARQPDPDESEYYAEREFGLVLQQDPLFAECVARLREGVFHVTGERGWLGICAEDRLFPSGYHLEPMWSGLATYWGAVSGSVCLLDFETPDDATLALFWEDKAKTTFTRAFRIGDSNDTLDLIRDYVRGVSSEEEAWSSPAVVLHFKHWSHLSGPWEFYRRESPFPRDNLHIPYLECFHRNPIPLRLVDEVHVVRMRRDAECSWKSIPGHEAVELAESLTSVLGED